MGYVVHLLLFRQFGVVDELLGGGQTAIEPRNIELTARFKELVIVAEMEERLTFIKVVALGVAGDLVGGEYLVEHTHREHYLRECHMPFRLIVHKSNTFF